ncbi:pannexin-2-like [Branchiostoma floridae x Branchiostoma japonicum]
MAGMLHTMLPDLTGEGRHGQVTLDTWFDRLMKALTVWLPLLVSGALFVGEISGEPQNVVCRPPSNFNIPQANYLNAFCKEILVTEQMMTLLFPNFVLLFGFLMYIPHFLWKMKLGTKLASQITFLTKEVEDIFRRLCALAALLGKIDEKDHLSQDQKNEKKSVARNQTLQSLSVLGSFVESLSGSKKLLKFQIAKFVLLVIFALLCLGYLIWFDIASQKDNTFACVIKVTSSDINGTEVDDHIESVCKVIGVRQLYFLSILLSISFCIAAPLPILYTVYIKLFKYNFVDKLQKKTTRLLEGITGAKVVESSKAKAFSDYAILSRLCGENRHLIPSLHTIINIAELQETLNAEQLQGALSSETGRVGVNNAAIIGEKNVWVDFAASAGNSIHVHNEDRTLLSTHHDNDGDFVMRNRRHPTRDTVQPVQAEDEYSQDRAIASPQKETVKAIVHQPMQPESFHTTDETRVKTLAEDETTPMALYRSASRSDNSESTDVKAFKSEEESVIPTARNSERTISTTRHGSVEEEAIQPSEGEEEKQNLLSDRESTV